MNFLNISENKNVVYIKKKKEQNTTLVTRRKKKSFFRVDFLLKIQVVFYYLFIYLFIYLFSNDRKNNFIYIENSKLKMINLKSILTKSFQCKNKK